MTPVVQSLSPPIRLAIAYAPGNLRAAFTLLLSFDQRLADIVGRSTEPMIAQMKIAWWHDALASEPALRPQGEPTFQALQILDMPEVEEAMVRLLDAWGQLLVTDDWDAEILSAFAKDRSTGVFGAYARLSGCFDDVTDVSAAGEIWALADLRLRFGEKIRFGGSPKFPVIKTRRLRPLSILAYSVNHPSGVRMIWHALTGR